ncbi:hypothetical protein HU200_053366 [Digitaria exilis]|uniref:Uncharacterized protein n=1 Tax=Digitaria exilis TaxID=1010633 RepID=A0A835E7T9_9POAL|nr:hypothetical protein HU200_053366 [Digitaria exilis]CAB3459987.1 unnamed protein product [Digitaria exilis]
MAAATMSMCSKSKQKKDGEHSSSSGSQQQTAAPPGMRKGPWTEEEDAQLVWFVRLFGERRWDFLAKVSGLRRTGKSCRLRWVNYLHPGLRRGRITADEERLILELHAQYGSRWSRIARSLPGRTDNEIKNYWRTRTRKQKAAAHQATAAAASSSSTVTTTTASCSGGSPSSGDCGSVLTESALREIGCGDDDAELDEAASTTTASHQHHHQQQQKQQDSTITMDQFWNEIAAADAAASYMMVDGGCWGGAGHPGAAAVEPSMPASPVWEDCSDYSLWRIDDEEYYKKMLHAS